MTKKYCTCGHKMEAHRISQFGFTVYYGVCLAKPCECLAFVERKDV